MNQAIDPICQMKVDPETAAGKTLHDAQTYYFCSMGCKEKFDASLARFTPAANPGPNFVQLGVAKPGAGLTQLSSAKPANGQPAKLSANVVKLGSAKSSAVQHNPILVTTHTQPVIEEGEIVPLPITGMPCAACARHIEQKLQATAGVQRAAVNFATARAT